MIDDFKKSSENCKKCFYTQQLTFFLLARRCIKILAIYRCNISNFPFSFPCVKQANIEKNTVKNMQNFSPVLFRKGSFLPSKLTEDIIAYCNWLCNFLNNFFVMKNNIEVNLAFSDLLFKLVKNIIVIATNN